MINRLQKERGRSSSIATASSVPSVTSVITYWLIVSQGLTQ